MNPQDVQTLKQFLTLTKSATRLEICGGTGLSRPIVEAILAATVDGGMVTKTGEDNTAVYALAGAPHVTEAAPAGPILTEAEKWAINARKEGLEAFKRSHPEEYPSPTPRVTISDDEVEIELAKRKAVTPLSESERADLEQRMRNRRPVNQQSHIVK